MKIDSKVEEGNLSIVLDGRLDSMTSGELEAHLEKQLTDSIQSLSIDLGAVDFISSKGLRVMVATYKKMNGRPMNLLNANASVKEVFRLSGLQKFFDLK